MKMKKQIGSLILCFLITGSLIAQTRYFTRNGKISFTSNALMENIEALNHSASSVMDIESGAIQFAVLIKGFEFEKALMQEHFNENYMESSKFPKSTFSGKVKNISEIDFNQDGEYPVLVSGNLSIHGVSREIETKGIIQIIEGKISAHANFDIAVADYDIKIPNLVKDNIAKIVRIAVALDYQAFEKT